MKINNLPSIIILIFASACFIGEELPPDQSPWSYDSPSNVGLSEQSLLDLDDAINVGSFDPVRSMLIIKDEQLVFENYYGADSRQTIRNIGRTTPLITILALGILHTEGTIPDLDERISVLIPENYANLLTGLKQEITLRHLLLQQSGLSWNETVFGGGLNNAENDLNLLLASPDPIDFLLEKPLEAQPGTRFSYNTGASLLLAEIIEFSSGMPFQEFVAERIFQPLNISTIEWSLDRRSKVNAATGLSISSLDLCKLGFLFLNQGIWKGEEIIAESWVNQSTATQVEISNSFNFGYYWQTLSDNLDFIPLGDPNDAYFFSQHLYVQPSQNLVITFGTEEEFLNTISSPLLLYREIITPLVL